MRPCPVIRLARPEDYRTPVSAICQNSTQGDVSTLDCGSAVEHQTQTAVPLKRRHLAARNCRHLRSYSVVDVERVLYDERTVLELHLRKKARQRRTGGQC